MIYLISPYWHDSPAVRTHRVEVAAHYVTSAAKKGIQIYSPIIHGHGVVTSAYADAADIDESFWRQHSVAMLMLMNRIWALKTPWLAKSNGSMNELGIAQLENKQVSYIDVEKQFIQRELELISEYESKGA